MTLVHLLDKSLEFSLVPISSMYSESIAYSIHRVYSTVT